LGAGQPAVAAHFPQPDTEQLPVALKVGHFLFYASVAGRSGWCAM
jgi:hypothetical protein